MKVSFHGRWITTLAFLCLVALVTGACSPANNNGDALPSDAADATNGDGDDVAGDSSSCQPEWLRPWQMPPRARFPQNFMWGSATAPYQIEGGLDNTDWAEWERRGRIVNNDRANDGPRSYEFFMDDVRVLRESAQNSYRVGIDWSRVFPTRAAWDRCRAATGAMRLTECRAAASVDGLAYYHRVLAALRAANITPLVTLMHFVFPNYLNDLSQDWHTQGWMNPDIGQHLAAWADFASREFAGEVDWWVTINEPLAQVLAGYLAAAHVPGQLAQFDVVVPMAERMIRAHVAMYDAIHANDTMIANATGPIMPARPSYISIAHHVRPFYPANCALRSDREAAVRGQSLLNAMFFDAIQRGNLDRNLNGTLDPDEPNNDPSLRGRVDYIGVNYYTLQVMQASSAIPVLHAIPQRDAVDHGLPKTEYGWDIYPRGFFEILTWAGSYGMPVVVTENGLADAAGVNRPRFVAEHLAVLAAAIRSGVNVVGYFHWSLMDNFEWSAGYHPRFGLYETDFRSPMRTRRARPGADTYRQIIMAGEVTDALLASMPMYRSATMFCAESAMNPVDGGR